MMLTGQRLSLTVVIDLPENATVVAARYQLSNLINITLADPQMTWNAVTKSLDINIDLNVTPNRTYEHEVWVELGDGAKWPVYVDSVLVKPSLVAGQVGP